jgi:hypothetical protein
MLIKRIAHRALISGVVLCGAVVAARVDAAPASVAAPYTAVRYPFGAPNYYGYFSRPWYLTPFRYSYYAAKYGWLYPRYYKPYHPYPIDPWHVAHVRSYGPWYGPNLGPWPYASVAPVAAPVESLTELPQRELPAAVRFAGCDYW